MERTPGFLFLLSLCWGQNAQEQPCPISGTPRIGPYGTADSVLPGVEVGAVEIEAVSNKKNKRAIRQLYRAHVFL